MSRLVYNCFKAIILSVIFIVAWEFVFYLYNTATFNQKMENIVASMQKSVMENNCMPAELDIMYCSMFAELFNSYNGFDGKTTGVTAQDIANYAVNGHSFNGKDFISGVSNKRDLFVLGIGWNYSSDAKLISGSTGENIKVYKVDPATGAAVTDHSITSLKMKDPSPYGSVKVVQVRARIVQPMFKWGKNLNGIDDMDTTPYGTTDLEYTYFVPCLKYEQVY